MINITNITLYCKLLSLTTFGYGATLPGVVDQEVQHDQYGLPYVRGRTLRGLLKEEIEAITFLLNQSNLSKKQIQPWFRAKERLLGKSGEMLHQTGILHIGNAQLSENLRKLLMFSILQKRTQSEPILTPETLLNALTTINRQTAITPLGTAEEATLRATRVLLSGITFQATISFDQVPDEFDYALLSAGVLAWRRAGISRNRGRGKLKAWLENKSWMKEKFKILENLLTPNLKNSAVKLDGETSN